VSKEIGSFLKPVVKNARGYLPSNEEAPSGWLKRPNAGVAGLIVSMIKLFASRGITFKSTPSKPNRHGLSSLSYLSLTSPQLALSDETAGRKSGVQGNFTPRLGGKLARQGQR